MDAEFNWCWGERRVLPWSGGEKAKKEAPTGDRQKCHRPQHQKGSNRSSFNPWGMLTYAKMDQVVFDYHLYINVQYTYSIYTYIHIVLQYLYMIYCSWFLGSMCHIIISLRIWCRPRTKWSPLLVVFPQRRPLIGQRPTVPIGSRWQPDQTPMSWLYLVYYIHNMICIYIYIYYNNGQ